MIRVQRRQDLDIVVRLVRDGEYYVFPEHDFKVSLYTCGSVVYEASYIGGVMTNMENDAGQIRLAVDDHRLHEGQLKIRFTAYVADEAYRDGFREVSKVTRTQVMLSDADDEYDGTLTIDVAYPDIDKAEGAVLLDQVMPWRPQRMGLRRGISLNSEPGVVYMTDGKVRIRVRPTYDEKSGIETGEVDLNRYRIFGKKITDGDIDASCFPECMSANIENGVLRWYVNRDIDPDREYSHAIRPVIRLSESFDHAGVMWRQEAHGIKNLVWVENVGYPALKPVERVGLKFEPSFSKAVWNVFYSVYDEANPKASIDVQNLVKHELHFRHFDGKPFVRVKRMKWFWSPRRFVRFRVTRAVFLKSQDYSMVLTARIRVRRNNGKGKVSPWTYFAIRKVFKGRHDLGYTDTYVQKMYEACYI